MEKQVITLSKVLQTSFALGALLIIIIIASSLYGTAKINPVEGIKTLIWGWYGGYEGLAQYEKTILLSIRLPRIIFAGLVGASLSVAGVIFQALLRNPLADPYILGISSGSSVGAIVGIITGLSFLPFGVPVLAFLGALITVFLVFTVGGGKRGFHSTTLLLAGVIINAFFSAVIMFIVSISSNVDLHTITFWLMGNVSFAGKTEILLTFLLLTAGFFITYSYARSLNLIVSSEETALHLGINVKRTRIILFLAGSLMTAAAVAFSGIIGFVGLIIPHMMRMVFGADHRLLLPVSLLFGASFLVVADTIARSAIPFTELPVGVITALCGAPYFIYLLRTRMVL